MAKARMKSPYRVVQEAIQQRLDTTGFLSYLRENGYRLADTERLTADRETLRRVRQALKEPDVE
jgi:nucleoid-associated protein YejK